MADQYVQGEDRTAVNTPDKRRRNRKRIAWAFYFSRTRSATVSTPTGRLIAAPEYALAKGVAAAGQRALGGIFLQGVDHHL